MRIGLFFGSFNPIHIGHLALANYVAEYGGVDKVMMVVSPLNPLKNAGDMMADEARVEMVRRAIDGYERIEASDVEFGLEKPSYTYLTLRHLKATHPEDEFVLIIGADNVEIFNKWKNYEEILESVEVMVYPREGYTRDLPYEKMRWIETPKIEVSSTFIRNAIREGKDVRHFMPKGVYEMAKEAMKGLRPKE